MNRPVNNESNTSTGAHNRIIIACLQQRRHYNKTFDGNTRPAGNSWVTLTHFFAAAAHATPRTANRGFLSSPSYVAHSFVFFGRNALHEVRVYRCFYSFAATCGEPWLPGASVPGRSGKMRRKEVIRRDAMKEKNVELGRTGPAHARIEADAQLPRYRDGEILEEATSRRGQCFSPTRDITSYFIHKSHPYPDVSP